MRDRDHICFIRGHAPETLMRRASRLVTAASTLASSSSRASSSSSSSSTSGRRLQKDFVEANYARGMRTGWHRRLFATSDPFDASKFLKGKPLPKDKRRIMVEAFVEKYRNANAGKFPSISYTREQVGGSFYVIRDILQMLEYESRNSSMKMQEIKSLQHIDKDGNAKEHDPFISRVKHSISIEVDKPTDIETGVAIVSNNTDLNESPSVKLEEKNTKPLSTAPVTSLDNDVELNHAKETGSFHVEPNPPVLVKPFDDGTSVSDSSEKYPTELEKSETILSDTKAMQLEGSQKPLPVNQDIPKSPDVHRDASGKLRDDEPLQKSSSIWSDVKSFAVGIINFWKKV